MVYFSAALAPFRLFFLGLLFLSSLTSGSESSLICNISYSPSSLAWTDYFFMLLSYLVNVANDYLFFLLWFGLRLVMVLLDGMRSTPGVVDFLRPPIDFERVLLRFLSFAGVFASVRFFGWYWMFIGLSLLIYLAAYRLSSLFKRAASSRNFVFLGLFGWFITSKMMV